MSEAMVTRRGGGGSFQTVDLSVNSISTTISFTGLSKQYDHYAVLDVMVYPHPSYTLARSCAWRGDGYQLNYFYANTDGKIVMVLKAVTPTIANNAFTIVSDWGAPFFGGYRLFAWDD